MGCAGRATAARSNPRGLRRGCGWWGRCDLDEAGEHGPRTRSSCGASSGSCSSSWCREGSGRTLDENLGERGHSATKDHRVALVQEDNAVRGNCGSIA